MNQFPAAHVLQMGRHKLFSQLCQSNKKLGCHLCFYLFTHKR